MTNAVGITYEILSVTKITLTWPYLRGFRNLNVVIKVLEIIEPPKEQHLKNLLFTALISNQMQIVSKV
jgi:hypothetical protein